VVNEVCLTGVLEGLGRHDNSDLRNGSLLLIDKTRAKDKTYI
jgi:hypothetical protein